MSRCHMSIEGYERSKKHAGDLFSRHRRIRYIHIFHPKKKVSRGHGVSTTGVMGKDEIRIVYTSRRTLLSSSPQSRGEVGRINTRIDAGAPFCDGDGILLCLDDTYGFVISLGGVGGTLRSGRCFGLPGLQRSRPCFGDDTSAEDGSPPQCSPSFPSLNY